ncbi:MAG: hypothetical protein R2911_27500 [Caldilineaceae bacterium]
MYQRLVATGFSHRFVALLYVGLALLNAGVALGWYLHLLSAWTVGLIIFASGSGLWISTRVQEREEEINLQADNPASL